MKITNEVLHERINNLSRTNSAEHKTIVKKQTVTNSRLTSLEKYKYKAIGAILMLNILLVPLVVWYITEKLAR